MDRHYEGIEHGDTDMYLAGWLQEVRETAIQKVLYDKYVNEPRHSISNDEFNHWMRQVHPAWVNWGDAR